MTDVAQKAADLRRNQSRQPWARVRRGVDDRYGVHPVVGDIDLVAVGLTATPSGSSRRDRAMSFDEDGPITHQVLCRLRVRLARSL